jgi:hypothetical protein
VRRVTKKRLRDLAVRETVGRHRRDPPLARRERVDAGQDEAARTGTGGDELLLRVLGEQRRARLLGELERLPQRLAGLGAAACAA